MKSNFYILIKYLTARRVTTRVTSLHPPGSDGRNVCFRWFPNIPYLLFFILIFLLSLLPRNYNLDLPYLVTTQHLAKIFLGIFSAVKTFSLLSFGASPLDVSRRLSTLFQAVNCLYRYWQLAAL